MLRYQQLLRRALDPEAERPLKLRDLARALGMPVPSLHNYVHYDVLPRIDNITKMSSYFNESISSLYSEDNALTANLVAAVRKLSDDQKQQLLAQLKAHPGAHTSDI
jgi:transcriptional regulator with XRE-family HTH domain